MGEMSVSIKFWLKNVKRRDHSEDLGVDASKVKVKENHAMRTYLGSGGISPRILKLGNKWR
jgi:hypothetical protein